MLPFSRSLSLALSKTKTKNQSRSNPNNCRHPLVKGSLFNPHINVVSCPATPIQLNEVSAFRGSHSRMGQTHLITDHDIRPSLCPGQSLLEAQRQDYNRKEASRQPSRREGVWKALVLVMKTSPSEPWGMTGRSPTHSACLGTSGHG